MSSASIDEYKDLVIHATMMVVGAVGVYRRRDTMASLYLDARVWWNKHFGAPRKSALKQQQEEEEAAAAQQEARVTRLRENGDDTDGADRNDAIGLLTFTDDASGVTVRSWQHVDGKRMRAVGDTAPFPNDFDASTTYQRVACPFVMLTYINARGEEHTLEADPLLWYTIAAGTASVVGVPKFTRDEVMYLVGQACPNSVSRIWTDEYTLECTTAEGKDVVLRNDQVMWTAATRAEAKTTPEEEEVVVDEPEEEEEQVMEEEEEEESEQQEEEAECEEEMTMEQEEDVDESIMQEEQDVDEKKRKAEDDDDHEDSKRSKLEEEYQEENEENEE